MSTCATCKWAGRNSPHAKDGDQYPLLCLKMGCNSHSMPIHVGTLAVAVDMESYLGCDGVQVAPTFGCVMWESKP
jgi:hypothetical protein